MSTRSMIAIEYADGSVEAIYCHSDGYIEHNGAILFTHYDRKKLEDLISNGDTSSISPEVEDCGFYHKEGESLSEVKATRHDSLKSFLKAHYDDGFGIEFIYILNKEGEWIFSENDGSTHLLWKALVDVNLAGDHLYLTEDGVAQMLDLAKSIKDGRYPIDEYIAKAGEVASPNEIYEDGII